VVMPDISYKQIINRALRLATMTGGESSASPMIDNAVVLEDMTPMALRQAIILGANNPNEVNQLKIPHVISITSGEAPLPDEVITECMDRSSVSSATDGSITELASFQPRLMSYLRPVHSQLAYYAVDGGNLLFREAGGDAGAYNGTITLTAVSMPVNVADLTTLLEITSDTAERAIGILAMMLRGEAG